MLSAQQYVFSTSARKSNPLSKIDFYPTDREWEEEGYFFKQITEVVIHPIDGVEHQMQRAITLIDGVEFSKSEQFVTYADGSMYTESIYWDNALQIYYWQSNNNGKWYLEDPLKNDAVFCLGSHKNLMEKLEQRQFWWLEVDEDVVVTRNADGSQSYAYKGLSDPIKITNLIETESKREEIKANKTVSKWKAGVIAAITLLGNLMGFQSLVKIYVPEVGPHQPEPSKADTTMQASQLLSSANAVTAESVQFEQHGHPNYFEQYLFADLVHQSRAIVNAIQFSSVMATGVAVMLRPRLDRDRSLLKFSNLLGLLMKTGRADGYISIEPVQSSAQKPAASSDREKFRHTFTISTENSYAHSSEPVISITRPVVRSQPQPNYVTFLPQPTPSPHSRSAISIHKPVTSSLKPTSDVAKPLVLPQNTTSNATRQTVVPIPVVHLPKRNQAAQSQPAQKNTTQLEQKTKQVPLSNRQRPTLLQGTSRALVSVNSYDPSVVASCGHDLYIMHLKVHACSVDLYNYYSDHKAQIGYSPDLLVQELNAYTTVHGLVGDVVAERDEPGVQQQRVCSDEVKNRLDYSFANTRNSLVVQTPDVHLDCVDGLRNGTFKPSYGESSDPTPTPTLDESNGLTIGLAVGGGVVVATAVAYSQGWWPFNNVDGRVRISDEDQITDTDPLLRLSDGTIRSKQKKGRSGENTRRLRVNVPTQGPKESTADPKDLSDYIDKLATRISCGQETDWNELGAVTGEILCLKNNKKVALKNRRGKTVETVVKEILENKIIAISSEVSEILPDDLEGLKARLTKLQQHETSLNEVVSVVNALSPDDKSDWNLLDLRQRAEEQNSKLKEKITEIEGKIKKLECQQIPKGIDVKTCKEIVEIDQGTQVYYDSAFYGVTDKNTMENLKHNGQNAAGEPIYFGELNECRTNQQGTYIDSVALGKWIASYHPGIPRDWNYVRNQAFWCGGIMAKRTFIRCGAPLKTKDLKDAYKDKLVKNAIEGDELLWLWQNQYKMSSENGKITLQTPPAPAYKPALDELKMGTYNVGDLNKVTATKRYVDSIPDNKKNEIEFIRKEKLNFLLSNTLFKKAKITNFEKEENVILEFRPSYRASV